MSTSLADQTREEQVERLKDRIETIRADRDRMAHRAERAIEARKKTEERAEKAYGAATEAMKILDEIFVDEDGEGMTPDHGMRFLEIWKRLNELSTASSWVEETEGIEVR